VQIKKYAEGKNFDIYCSTRDTMFLDSIKVWLQRPLQYYIDSFQMNIYNRFNLVILYDEKTGMDLTGYDNFNGGAGGNSGVRGISPHNFWNGIEGYPWLLAHEFGHVFNNLMYCDFPHGFYQEGMANLSGYIVAGDEHLDDHWKIKTVFDYYKNKYGRDPTLYEFINNPDADDPDFYGIDCYFFGFEFMRFLKNHEGFLKIKEFFNKGLDYNVFSMSYDEIEAGYIAYLKSLVDLTGVSEISENSKLALTVFPNPLTTVSVISFQTKSRGHVSLIIYDMQGRKVYSLLNDEMDQGKHRIQLGGYNLRQGIYLCRLISPDGNSTLKLVVK
jgi:hypothetical protein